MENVSRMAPQITPQLSEFAPQLAVLIVVDHDRGNHEMTVGGIRDAPASRLIDINALQPQRPSSLIVAD
jgi:hypothetical protein